MNACKNRGAHPLRVIQSIMPRVFTVLILIGGAVSSAMAAAIPASIASTTPTTTEIYIGEQVSFTYSGGTFERPAGSNFFDSVHSSTFVWASVAGGAGKVEFDDPSASDPCNRFAATVTDTNAGCQNTHLVLGTQIGTVTIQVNSTGDSGFCSSFISGTCPNRNATLTIKILPRNSSPDKMPLGSKLRRVDVHGVPMPDPSPTGEGEGDRIPNMSYTDMYDLTPKYATTDIAVPVDGGELTLEFRRSMSIHSRNYNPDLTQLGITYPTEDLLGLGWDVNLGSRVLLTTEKDKSGVNYTSARVIDEVGNSYTYQTDPTFSTFTPDITHAFNNESVKATLVSSGGFLVLTKSHGTKLTYEHVGLFTAPFTVGPTCATPPEIHTEDYWRLKSVTDRNGNQLAFSYHTNSADGPNYNLVVNKIAFVNNGQPNDTQRFITINATHHTEYDENLALGITTGRDSGWRINSVVDALGRATSFQYTAAVPLGPPGLPANTLPGLLQQVTKPLVEDPANPTGPQVAPTIQFTYNVLDLPDSVIDPVNPPTGKPAGINRFVAPLVITDARGNQTTMTYGSAWFPTSIYAKLGTAVWQKRIYLTKMTTIDGDALFGLTTLAFDVGAGSMPTLLTVQTTATDTRGVVTSYAFNSAVVQVANSVGAAIFVTNCTRSTAGVGTTTFVWADPSGNPDPNNNLTQVTDLSGNIITFAYTSGAGDAYDKGIVNPAGALNAFSNPNHYMAYCQPALRTVDPTGLNIQTQYRYETAFNKELSQIDAEGKTTNYTIDVKGNRTDVIEAVGTPVQRTTHYVYAANGFITQMVTSFGNSDARIINNAQSFSPSTLNTYQTTTSTVVGFSGTPLNLITTSVADVQGNQNSVTDPNNNVTTMVYDNLNRQTSMTKPAVINSVGTLTASTSETHYDLNGNVIRTVDDEGNASTTTFDLMNRPTQTRRRMTSPTTDDNANDLITTTNYTNSSSDARSVGLTRFTVDPMGRQTDFAYDNMLRLTLKTLPTVTLPGGSTVRYTEQYLYDGGNAGSGAFAYWSGWQPTRVIDKRGFFTDTTYDKIYRPIQIVQRKDASILSTNSSAAPLAGEPTVTKTYNKLHKVLSQTTLNENFAGTAANQITYTSYDSLYRPTVTITDVDGTFTPAPAPFIDGGIAYTTTNTTAMVTRSGYDNAGNVLQVKDAENHLTTNTYDGNNRMTQTVGESVALVDPAGFNSGSTVSPTTVITYDKNGNKTQIEDPNHAKTKLVYDARNRATQTILDLDGNGTFATTFNGPDIVTNTRYNLVGKVVKVTDSRGNDTDTAYDRAYRVLTVTQPAVADQENNNTLTRPVVTSTYDKNSNVLTMQDARQLAHAPTVKTVNTYDELNRLRTSTQASGSTEALPTESQYDANNNVTALILTNSAGSGGNQTTTYTFDAFNRKLTEVLPSPDAQTRQTQWSYYRNGTVMVMTDALGQLHERDYDRANRLTQSRDKIVSPPSTAETRNFTYNRTSKLLTVSDVAGSSTNTYDALDRLLTESRTSTGQTAYTVTSGYDAASNCTRMIYPSAVRTLNNTFDRARRLTAVTDGTKVTSYTYDVNGNCLTLSKPNPVIQTNTYDAINRMVTSTTKKGTKTFDSYTYRFDLVGNRRSVDETLDLIGSRTTTYGYDNQYRITSEAWSGFSQTYQYDLAGNRTQLVTVNGSTTTTVNTYDILNRLMSSTKAGVATSYTYDNNGNQATQTTSGVTTTLTWDINNRLAQTVSAATTVTYTYDYRSRRQTRIVTGGAQTFYRYGGDVSFQEVTSGSTSVQAELVRGVDMGGGIGAILYSNRPSAGDEFFNYNPSVGNMVAITNSSGGSATQEDRYDAFGVVINASGSSLNNRLANTKERETVGPLTLDYHGMRYYNSITGRYISRDPIGYGDGLNVYLYVHNNPINNIDPLGLGPWDFFSDAIRKLNENGGNEGGGGGAARNAPIGGANRVEVKGPDAGGTTPAERGQAGHEAMDKALEAQGEKIIGKEITVETESGTRMRLDTATAADPEGNAININESKNGKSADYTKPQAKAFNELEKSPNPHVIPRGENAAKAGLKPGVPVPVNEVRTFRWGGRTGAMDPASGGAGALFLMGIEVALDTYKDIKEYNAESASHEREEARDRMHHGPPKK